MDGAVAEPNAGRAGPGPAASPGNTGEGGREAEPAREEAIERLSRLYHALIRLVSAGHRAQSRTELFDGVCHALVKDGPILMAWVGWLDPATTEVRPVAAAGDSGGYLGRVHIYANLSPEGRGPTGTALRENRTAICADISTEPWSRPWREALRTAGYRSSISIPIRRTDRPMGALTAYSSDPGCFGDREVLLLEEASREIARGVERLEVEADRRGAEARVAAQLEELRRWYDATVDREIRILELKAEVNRALQLAGEGPRYSVAGADAGNPSDV